MEGERLLMAAQANVGRGGAATPTGHFSIIHKDKTRHRGCEPDDAYPTADWTELQAKKAALTSEALQVISTTNLISSGTTAREKVNLRTPDVMAAVQEQVEQHYRSDIVDKVRRAGGIIKVGDTTVRLAKQFGFCYGVERAIDLAYAARKVFKDRRLFIVGEIIHNPEVNHQIASLGIKNLTGRNKQADISDLEPDDVVIVPAFGTELSMLQQIKERGCQIVDTTCGDVLSVWQRVSKYARESVT